MNKDEQIGSDKRFWFFVCVLGIGIVVFWIAAAVTEWKSTQTVLFRWDFWYFMDWFGELHRIQTGVYTGNEAVANYPAFCFLIFKIFYSFLPERADVVYDDYSIRAKQQSVVPFVVFMIFLIFMLYHILRYYMREKTKLEREIFVAAIFLSAPFLFMFERGNLIIIALLGTVLYVMLYDSPRPICRAAAYICLSAAAAIKLYPAVFGILTVLTKRYKETVILVAIGIAVFLLPFSMFGGVEGCLAFFHSIFGSHVAFSDYGFGYDFSAYNLERLLLSLSIGYQKEATNISTIMVLLCLMIVFLCAREFWQRLCVLSLSIILLPKFSYFYTVCFLILPILYLFQCESRRIHYLYICEFLLIFFPWLHIPLDRVNYMAGEEFSHLMGAGHILIYMGILSLLVTLLFDGIYDKMQHGFFTKKKRKKRRKKKAVKRVHRSKTGRRR